MFTKVYQSTLFILHMLLFSAVNAGLICYYEVNNFNEIKCFPPYVSYSEYINNDVLSIVTIEDIQNQNIYSIDLTNCSISGIASNDFYKFPDIQKLDLSFNEIQELTKDAFINVPKLISLRLAGNKIQEILADAFQPLKQLGLLDLSDNYLYINNAKPLFQSTVKSLRVLDLYGNTFVNISSIPMKNLQWLKSSNSHLEKEKLDLSNMLYLNLSNSPEIKLTEDQFDSAANLKILDLSYCGIKYLPFDIFKDAKQLRELLLAHNEIEVMATMSFAFNSELKLLDLSFNKINKIDAEIFLNNKNLQYINLERNDLTQLSEKLFSSLEKLETLNLANNALNSLNSVIFYSNTNLQSLYLNNNLLTGIGHLFDSNKNLRILDMANNRLQKLKFESVEQLEKLHVLNLENNCLMNIDKRVMTMKQLSIFHISCNRITFLEPKFFDAVQNLGINIHMRGNPLKCSCLNEFLSNNNVTFKRTGLTDGAFPSCIIGNGICNEQLLLYEYQEWLEASKFNPSECSFKKCKI